MTTDRTITAAFAAPPPPPAQIDFWSNDGTDGSLFVYIDGILQGQLTQYFLYPNEPAWGASGTLLVTGIPPGSHTLSATSSGVTSWPGTVVSLTSGEQLKWQFSVTQWCFWTNRGNVGAYINIYVDGVYVGALTRYFTGVPTWAQVGTLTVSTTPGAHTLYAASQSGVYWGPTSVSLTSGQQQLYELY
jgi:hypothetical protein